MRIAITGTKGIPNHYGGFEQFAEKLAVGLSGRGHEVTVYNPHFHPYKKDEFHGVKILNKNLWERILGAGGNYFYDYSCLKDAIRRDADVILECGYASASPWYPVLRRGRTKLITHMDGMEWQREKWGRFAKKIIRWTERLAVRYSDVLVCDHPEVANYYRQKYKVIPELIPYGAKIRGTGAAAWDNWEVGRSGEPGLEPGRYYLLVARLEPENNIRMIIEGFLASSAVDPLLVVGDYSGKYGRKIFRDFGGNNRLRFLGGIFDPDRLDHLRHFARVAFHGHSVGGTNPSLLENMAADVAIIAHDNIYNKWVLGKNTEYFQSSEEVRVLINKGLGIGDLAEDKKAGEGLAVEEMISNNLKRIEQDFQWDQIVRKYEELFKRVIG